MRKTKLGIWATNKIKTWGKVITMMYVVSLNRKDHFSVGFTIHVHISIHHVQMVQNTDIFHMQPIITAIGWMALI